MHSTSRRTLLAAACVAAFALPAVAQPQGGAPAEEHPLVPALRLARESQEAAKALKDYAAVFTRQEVVGGRMNGSQMQMKFRSVPTSVYLKFINPENAGREVLFVEGRNNNLMLAHETGLKALIGTVSLDPQSQAAMAEARYPVTRIGIANLVTSVLNQWEKETAFGEVDVKYYAEAKLGDRPVTVIETSHPTPRRQFKYQVSRLWIDNETKLPVRVQHYEFARVPGAPPVLVEDYTYTDVKPNVGLTDADFDSRNPQYAF